jgi:uncharacterized membrane protein
MDTTKFEGLLPRLSTAELDLHSIKRDLHRAILESKASPEPQPQAAATLPEPEAVEAPAPPAPIRQSGMTAGDLENVLAGRWLHIAGLLLVFIGTAFFLKVAFDHNWITPAFRIALGLVAGAGAIVYAQHLANKGQRYFSEGITALGAGIEFLSLYASNALFHLASPALVLAGMVIVNAAIAALAWRRGSERLGILAAIGGFLAPLLAGTQSADQWMLAGYVGILAAALLTLGELIDSKIVAPLALSGTILYALGSFSLASSLDDTQRAGIYIGLYATFALAGWIVAKVRGSLDPVRSILGGVALGFLLIGLESTLAAEHRMALAGVLLALTVAHLGVAVWLKSRFHSWLAAAALTFAIPAAFEHAAYVNVAWAIEAAVLTISGLAFRDETLKYAGLALLAIDVTRDAVLYATFETFRPILNERFGACIATLAATYTMARAIDLDGTALHDQTIVRALRTLAHTVALASLSTEAWLGVAYYGGAEQASSAALSIVWAVFAAMLIGFGLYKRDSFVRWEGLGLIVLTAAKVVLFDLSFLDLGYRVISAVLVGLALIGISYAYQRRLSATP